MSRLLVTLQGASITPLSPTTDHRYWWYVGSIPQIHSTRTAYSRYTLLDHVRHLLVAEPTLAAHGLAGGLVVWLERNTSELVEWSLAARGDWQSGSTGAVLQVRQQLQRVLVLLDGVTSAPLDLPGAGPYTGVVSSPMANVALLPLENQENSFSLVTDIDFHLQGVAASPGVTTNQQQECATILAVVDHIDVWLSQVRADDRRLLQMSDQRLLQPEALSLLDDMQSNAISAFSGQLNQVTGTTQEGAEWVYESAQGLAEMQVTTATR